MQDTSVYCCNIAAIAQYTREILILLDASSISWLIDIFVILIRDKFVLIRDKLAGIERLVRIFAAKMNAF